MSVTYVKLSAERMLLDDSAQDRQKTALKDYGRYITTDFYKKTDEDFPQYLTRKLLWDKEQFLAIAELGCRAMVRKYAENLLSPSGETCIAIDRVTTTGTAGKK
jgi:hypothetical protein